MRANTGAGEVTGEVRSEAALLHGLVQVLERFAAGDHLADGSILAADEFDVFILQLLEGNNVGLHSAVLVGQGFKWNTLAGDVAHT